MTLPAIVPVRAHLDARGSLGVIEQSDMPFPVQRVYYLFDERWFQKSEQPG
jgi:hypothetical protein